VRRMQIKQAMSSQETRHLDLGCGPSPRNPFNMNLLFGVDLTPLNKPGIVVQRANLASEPIPFESDYFDSISAFDFLEHIPRQIYLESTREIIFPFIRLMDEIYRVLKPEGRFLAHTPNFTSDEAYQDPTHVNPVTTRTHEYFCLPKLWGAMYGFKGSFVVEYVGITDMTNVKNLEFGTFRGGLRDTHRKIFGKAPTHVCWLLRAVK
jgi:SAM-dependent methyltransferase